MLSNTIGVAPSTIQKHINRLKEEGFIIAQEKIKSM